MHPLLVRLIALFRSHQLSRQLRVIEQRIATLSRGARLRLSVMTLREIGQAAGSAYPHLHGTPPEDRYQPWGSGTALGFARAGSDNPELALRGVALWLAAAYHETKTAPFARLQDQHRQLLRMVRELKALQTAPANEPNDTVQSWMQPTAAV